MAASVAEIVSFKLKPEADEATFVRNSQPVDRFCQTQPGFVSRRLMHDEAGERIDSIEWADEAAALKAAELMPKAEGVGPFLAAIDMPSLVIKRLTIRHRL